MERLNVVGQKSIKDILYVCDKTNLVPLFWGPPGIGKSAIIEKYSRYIYGKNAIVLIGSVMDPTDIVGHFRIDENSEYVKQYKPQFLVDLENGKSNVLFFDEINTAPPLVFAALLRILNERKVLNYPIPENTFIVAAANPPEQAPNASDLSLSFETRFVHIHVDTSIKEIREDFITGFSDEWKFPEFDKTKYENSLPFARSVVISFLSDQSPHITIESDGQSGGVNFRTAEYASRIVAFYHSHKFPNRKIVRAILSGILGNVGYGVLDYLEKLKLPNIEEVLKTNPSDLFTKYPGSTYQIITMLFFEFFDNPPIREKIIEKMKEFMEYDEAIFVLFGRLIKAKDKNLLQEYFVKNETFRNMVMKVLN